MPRLEQLALSPSEGEENRWIAGAIRRQARGDSVIQILEAGCGQRWPIKLDGAEYHLTGVDQDKHALALRQQIQRDLHETIVGDLRTVDLGSGRFDVVYSAFVLEHVPGAEKVLESFVRWLRPGGIVVLRVPDPYSVYGFLSRSSPHWIHVFYYRWLLGNRNAGKPGHAPYPTYYDRSVSRRGIREFCVKNGLSIELEVGDGYWRPGRGILRIMIAAVTRLMSLLSFGRLSHTHTNLLYILRAQTGHDSS